MICVNKYLRTDGSKLIDIAKMKQLLILVFPIWSFSLIGPISQMLKKPVVPKEVTCYS